MNGKRRCAVTDREKLQAAVKLTVNYEFGTLCDFVATLGLPENAVKTIQSRVRTHGNNITRVVNNHVDSYNVTKKHTTPVDANFIADRLQKEG